MRARRCAQRKCSHSTTSSHSRVDQRPTLAFLFSFLGCVSSQKCTNSLLAQRFFCARLGRAATEGTGRNDTLRIKVPKFSMDIRNRVNIENVILGEGGERTVNGDSETPVGCQIGSGSWLDEFKVFVATNIRNDWKNWSGATRAHRHLSSMSRALCSRAPAATSCDDVSFGRLVWATDQHHPL